MLAWLGQIVADAISFSVGQALGDAMRKRRPQLTRRAIERRRAVYGLIFMLSCSAVFATLVAPPWAGAVYLFGGGILAGVFSLGSLLELKRMEDSPP